MKLSIIVPVYNASLSIEKCYSSIEEQDFKDLEVIFIDDCSVDNSYEICKKLQSEIFDTKVIQNETNSLSGFSRNRGIKEAKGEYIWFIDSDDWLQSGALNAISKKLSEHKNVDILVVGYQEHHKEMNPSVIKKVPFDGYNGRDYMEVLLEMDSGVSFLPPTNVIRKEFLKENEVLFPEGVYYEDIMFSAKAFEKALEIRTLPKVCYNYDRTNMESITHTSSIKKIKDLLYAYENLSSLLLEVKASKRQNNLFILQFMICCLSSCFQMLDGLTVNKKVEQELRDSLNIYLNSSKMNEEYWESMIGYIKKSNMSPLVKGASLYNLSYLKKKVGKIEDTSYNL